MTSPLEQQTLETLDSLYINEKFEEHCSDAAKELAKDNNLNPDYYEPFIEFYIEECRESDRGYFFGDQKYIIDLIIIKICIKLKHLIWRLKNDLKSIVSGYELVEN